MNTTIKVEADCDYYVYLDENKKVIGFDLSPDERQSLALKYNSTEDQEPRIPDKAISILEVFAVSSVLIWMMNHDKRGTLLFYRPDYSDLSKAVHTMLNLPQMSLIPIEKPGEATIATKALSDAVKPVPDELTSEETVMFERAWSNVGEWIRLWKSQPELQRKMLLYSGQKDVKDQRTKNLPINPTSATDSKLPLKIVVDNCNKK